MSIYITLYWMRFLTMWLPLSFHIICLFMFCDVSWIYSLIKEAISPHNIHRQSLDIDLTLHSSSDYLNCIKQLRVGTDLCFNLVKPFLHLRTQAPGMSPVQTHDAKWLCPSQTHTHCFLQLHLNYLYFLLKPYTSIYFCSPSAFLIEYHMAKPKQHNQKQQIRYEY